MATAADTTIAGAAELRIPDSARRRQLPELALARPTPAREADYPHAAPEVERKRSPT
jgi:hypothetical protein